ncbi:MAG: alkaline phosphatase family protein [Fimbriimonadaceae bacterium]|nr:alkaline phosphatase family protein [Fimbriimonadaceae bacterium]
MDRTVVLVSVDGMRPDALRAAKTPCLDRLRERAAYTDRARTVMPSVTLPCHTSMLRGVDVTRHGITTNVFVPLARPVPSLFDLASRAGKRCGAFMNWGPLRDLYEPESVEAAYFIADSKTEAGDTSVARSAVAHHAERPFDFLFVYLGRTDSMGHDHGWMSAPYLDAIRHADACIAPLVEALDRKQRPWTMLVQSDHGGHDRSHGTEMDEDMTIPWMLVGDGVRPGELPDGVRIVDTAPTLAVLLGLTPAREWDGRPVAPALAD